MASSSSSRSYDYDVFISFRGEDNRKTFVDYLYDTLSNRMTIFTYKDDETLPRGESIGPSLFKAIEGSQIAVIIFSERYADSSWCLDELAHIMKCRDERNLIVIPIFYGVVPSDVRKQQGDFGKGFAEQVVRNNIEKVEIWRKAIIGACEIAGWETKNIANGYEMEAINKIAHTISETLLVMPSDDVNKDLVGMVVRLQELEKELDIKSPGVRIVGIWGVGGGGKTTLATSLCRSISRHFQGYCIVENIRVESAKRGGLKTLQEELLLRLTKSKTELQSVSHGKLIIKSRLSRRHVLIILDDVDHIDQLDALAGSCDWFGSGSRIIITTRNEQLLISHKEVRVFPITLLSFEEAIQLFNKRAYHKDHLVKDYDTLSSSVVSYAAGLPLALKVIGSFLRGKNEEEWRCTLARLKHNPDMEIVEILKISYDGLKPSEKQIFLDIACFFRRQPTSEAMEMFEACGYDPGIGITVLRQKALITIDICDRFDMHDLIQDMGHYIVKGDHPNDPEKHSRVWENENLKYLEGARMENDNIEAIQVYCPFDDRVDASLFYKMISNMKKLRCLRVIQPNIYQHAKGPSFLSNELRYINWDCYPISSFPDCFQPMKLVHLRLYDGLPKELWNGSKYLPQLKVLQLAYMENLLYTPDFSGLPSLQKLKLHRCGKLKKIHPSLGEHTSLEYVSVSYCDKLKMFPTIIRMGKLKTLKIYGVLESLEFPEIKSNMKSLVKLSLHRIGIDALLSSIEERCTNLTSLFLINCHLKIIDANFDGLKHLKDFSLQNLKYMQMPLGNRVPSRHGCGSLIFVVFRQLTLCLQKLNCMQMPLGDRTPSRDGNGSQFPIRLQPLFPLLTLSLQKLNLCDCHLTDGEIPSGIVELSNLRELNLSCNYFTKLHFSLSQLTQLKALYLSQCQSLVEFPELPSRLAILKADGCDELKSIGDLKEKCKWLCQVSLRYGSIVNDGNGLLDTMLQENANDHNMIVELKGYELAKGFRSPLLSGFRCRLQLPENWRNDFSGFLICFARKVACFSPLLCMEQVTSGMESEKDVGWEESYHSDEFLTEVRYISFASFRHTAFARWNLTYNEALFYINLRADGFGVKLVPRKSGSGQTLTSTPQEEYEFSNYTPRLQILRDPVEGLLSNSADAVHFKFDSTHNVDLFER